MANNQMTIHGLIQNLQQMMQNKKYVKFNRQLIQIRRKKGKTYHRYFQPKNPKSLHHLRLHHLIYNQINQMQIYFDKQPSQKKSMILNTMLDLDFAICASCNRSIEEEFCQIRQCKHYYHRECLKNKMQSQIDKFGFPQCLCVGKCNNGRMCYQPIALRDFKQLWTNEKFKQMKERLSISEVQKIIINSKLSLCPTLNCDYVFQFISHLPNQNSCPKCKTKYCLACEKKLESNQITCCNKQLVSFQNKKCCVHCGEFNKVPKGLDTQIKCCKCDNLFQYIN